MLTVLYVSFVWLQRLCLSWHGITAAQRKWLGNSLIIPNHFCREQRVYELIISPMENLLQYVKYIVAGTKISAGPSRRSLFDQSRVHVSCRICGNPSEC